MQIVTILLAVISCVIAEPTALNETIIKLFKTIQSLQETNDAPYKPPFSWGTQKGMYKNEVRLNFHGSEELALVRDRFSVPDTNSFTASWVTSCLLEAYKYGKAPRPSESQISMALDVIDKYRNKNVPYETSEMTFWPQILNKTANFYQSTPENLYGVMKLPDYMPKTLVEKILKFFHLYDLEEVFEKLIEERFNFAAAFHIPPDFDDTFVNIGLGSLFASDIRFAGEAEQWRRQNKNLTSVFAALKKYAYRPFSLDQRINTIDPRTYFYLHDFIEKSSLSGGDLALVSTWIQDTDEVRTQQTKGVAMPFNINNVDVTVASNAVFGITMVAVTNVSSDPLALIDAEIEQIYLNTTALIAHEIANNLTSRPDLALTYYPSKYEFYWFVTRTYAYLNRFYIQDWAQKVDPRLDAMVRRAFNILQPVLLTTMTEDILKSAKVDSDGTMYLDDFLGNNDVDLFNKTLNRAEDRIFTTAIAMAALINTWTQWNGTQLIWERETRSDVKQLISKGVQWLNTNTFSGKYKAWNSFFSGSGKGLKSMPFIYPANRLEFFNGTHFTDDKYPSGLNHIIGFQGHATPDEYSAMLKRPHFGKMTPMAFDGYNSEAGGFFPFWSSDAYTYSVTLLVLSEYDSIKSDSMVK